MTQDEFTIDQLKNRNRKKNVLRGTPVRSKPGQVQGGYMPKPLNEKRRRNYPAQTPYERKMGVKDENGNNINPWAYKISDGNFRDFYVLATDLGWWSNSQKVKELIIAFKMGCTDKEAASFAGISQSQLDNFEHVHPEFWEVKEACKSLMNVQARKNIRSMLRKGDKDVTKWYAERQMEDYEPKRTEKKKEENSMAEMLKKLQEDSRVVDYNENTDSYEK